MRPNLRSALKLAGLTLAATACGKELPPILLPPSELDIVKTGEYPPGLDLQERADMMMRVVSAAYRGFITGLPSTWKPPTAEVVSEDQFLSHARALFQAQGYTDEQITAVDLPDLHLRAVPSADNTTVYINAGTFEKSSSGSEEKEDKETHLSRSKTEDEKREMLRLSYLLCQALTEGPVISLFEPIDLEGKTGTPLILDTAQGLSAHGKYKDKLRMGLVGFGLGLQIYLTQRILELKGFPEFEFSGPPGDTAKVVKKIVDRLNLPIERLVNYAQTSNVNGFTEYLGNYYGVQKPNPDLNSGWLMFMIPDFLILGLVDLNKALGMVDLFISNPGRSDDVQAKLEEYKELVNHSLRPSLQLALEKYRGPDDPTPTMDALVAQFLLSSEDSV
ncbi:MAG: hypothetical protein UV61_C0015G0012 [Candidatus Gottesmanbacteria bacterium GW2011_GWB1_43_11]|uniref:Uncharacterized protein n=1 Tax=Candidatus Gottesmanbacteria bacterium GW2011_GWB1_43_11 TaxID=1618446 RepID=A0A0G1FG13_9BACT|nr:MAG: hypothetical protein UV04_C0036G0014 [Candidatus Gottesmanbacteria bacterium GW2011_GWA2_42_16]KKS81109.1 MAG: hypothetical protein UV55_C0021G0010 [Candidatus Gottesmanbacteria bacterium GW2011_GWC1_43_10]KKS85798.1 MAG: hypothetical protein UV61_C0015G0012 [Candidatus Gottesmanbacteria bacterium GW2011_GWB1_43_11]OGG09992.1 MAG: hypothetical protein A2699_04165 [Candidatus Gottesmanbacteria bacterium RIFCSPHIGHO2_01_FULL_43_15]OGG25341.1 MAG: hypothetical protein A3A59_02770 [Candidat